MIKFSNFYILKEGGNVFSTSRINKEDIPKTVDELSNICGKSLKSRIVGTAGKKDSSGDLDFIIEVGEKDVFLKKLNDWCLSRNLPYNDFVKRSGVGIHFKCPIVGKVEQFVQVDFIVVNDLEFAKFVFASNEVEPFKGGHRHIVLASIAKHFKMRWSVKRGLVDRDTDQIINNNNPDRIAKILFNNTDATKSDISSIKHIFKFLKKNFEDSEIKQMLEEARQTIKKDGIDIIKQLYNPNERKPIPHLFSTANAKYSMPFKQFEDFVYELDKNNGVLATGNSIVSEKADGMNIKFGIQEDGEFFIQSSYSGMIKSSKDKELDNIKYPQARAAFIDGFPKISRLLRKTLKEFVDTFDLEGIVVHAEWLYSPLAIKRNDNPNIVYFVSTDYVKDTLGKWSTFPLIKVTDLNGNELNDDIQECVMNIIQTKSTKDTIFIPLKVAEFESVDLSEEVSNAKNEIERLRMMYPILDQALKPKSDIPLSIKREINKSVTSACIPYQRRMHEKIYNTLSKIGGKLGEVEGFVIKFKSQSKNIIFKVINDKFYSV